MEKQVRIPAACLTIVATDQAPEPSEELFKESDQLHERAVQSLQDLFQQARAVLRCNVKRYCEWESGIDMD